MSRAIGDPDELDRFSQALSAFLDTLNDAVSGLNHSFSELGDSWQDEKRIRFEEEYSTLIQQLSNFESSASEQIPYLKALAARLRDYLQC